MEFFIINKFKSLANKIKFIFNTISASAELQLDAFIFSKEKELQVRALISGTGLHIIIPIEKMQNPHNFFNRFSCIDQEIINSVLNDSFSMSHLMSGKKIQLASKTFSRIHKGTIFKILAVDDCGKCIDFEVDPTELSRNKFVLKLFNKQDIFHIGYAAAENRILTETAEIKEANRISQKHASK